MFTEHNILDSLSCTQLFFNLNLSKRPKILQTVKNICGFFEIKLLFYVAPQGRIKNNKYNLQQNRF